MYLVVVVVVVVVRAIIVSILGLCDPFVIQILPRKIRFIPPKLFVLSASIIEL